MLFCKNDFINLVYNPDYFESLFSGAADVY